MELEEQICNLLKHDMSHYTADEIRMLLRYKGNEATFFRILKALVKNQSLIKIGVYYQWNGKIQ